jgi:serine/threonine-protein kinase
MYGEAIAEFKKGLELWGRNALSLGYLGHAYAVSGQRDNALQVLAELHKLANRRYVAPIDAAAIYAGLGDQERALEFLEKAVEDRSRPLIFLRVDYRFDSLRDDPRFVSLLRRIGLEP